MHFGFPLQGPTPGCSTQTSSQISAPPASASVFFGHFKSMMPSELPLGRAMPGSRVHLGVWGLSFLSVLVHCYCVSLDKSLPLCELSRHICQLKWGRRERGCGCSKALCVGRWKLQEGFQ